MIYNNGDSQRSPTRDLLAKILPDSKASPRPSAVAHNTATADYCTMVTTTSPHSTKVEAGKVSIFSIFFSKRTSMVCTYAFPIAFITCTILLVFNPSRHSVPFGFKKVVHTSVDSSSKTPNPSLKRNSLPHFDEDVVIDHKGFQAGPPQLSGGNGVMKENVEVQRDSQIATARSSSPPTILSLFKDTNHTENSHFSGEVGKVEGSGRTNETKKSVNSHSSSNKKKGGKKKGSDSKKGLNKKPGKQTGHGLKLKNECDLFDGRWVRDNTYPLYAAGTCPYIDEPFNCFLNGRPDNGYEKYRWQPKRCNVPRLNGKRMLRMLAGKRLVYIGDSLNRNMWEALLCVLRNSVEDKSKVFEVSGRQEFRTENSYSFIFQDYNCSVEFFQSRFLVRESEMKDKNGIKKETLRLDLMEKDADNYKDADVLIFNTGHWWTHEKTSNGLGYYQEGSHVYDELNGEEAYRRALKTWGRWVDTKVDPKKTAVFFRGYSPSHFRGGAWNSGGQCNGETKPTTDTADTEFLGEYPSNMKILDSVMEKMKTPIFYLNITRMTDFRKDAHPSVYRMPNLTAKEIKSTAIQDCAHWCLPGVPDTWNELIYAQLLRHNLKKQKKKQHKQKHEQQNQRTPFGPF